MSFEESISVYSLAFSGIGVLAETDQKIFLRLLFERVSLPTLSNFLALIYYCLIRFVIFLALRVFRT